MKKLLRAVDFYTGAARAFLFQPSLFKEPTNNRTVFVQRHKYNWVQPENTQQRRQKCSWICFFFICPPSLCNYVKETLALKSNKIIHNFFYVLAGIRELYTKKQNANTVWNSNKFLLEIKCTSVFFNGVPNILVRKIKPLIVGEWCVWILVFHSFSGCISQQATRTFTKTQPLNNYDEVSR